MKQKILLLIAIFSYYTGINLIFYWLNRKAKRILTFHNVLPDEIVVNDGVTISTTDFVLIVKEVARKYSFSLDLFDPKTATITFDDGYANQAEIAFKYLSNFKIGGNVFNIPAYLFLTGDTKDNGGKPLLVDELLLWCSHAPKHLVTSLARDAKTSTWVSYIRPAYVAAKQTRGKDIWDELNNLYPFSKLWASLSISYRHLRFDKVTNADIQRLESLGWKVGCHAKTHFPLSALTFDEKQEELTPPKQYNRFKEIVLSYPYGELMSVDKETLNVAKDIGYPYALGNITAPNDLHGDYFLPRMTLSVNKYLLHFRLSGFEHFLKFRKLLWYKK